MTLFGQLFSEQQRILNHFFQTLDMEAVQRVFNILLRCEGAIVLSGVGKSGLIAQKIAATLTSTGTRSHFLAPLNALHGDLGALGPSDLFLALSKSGESQELLDILPYIEKKGARTLAVVSKWPSRLSVAAQDAIYLPLLRELCPYDLVPTTSATVQLLFGDALAIALMQAKGFSTDAFALNHPAGLLGKKLNLRVADLMRRGNAIPICRPTDKLLDVLPELSSKRCGCLLVVENGELQGIFTDGDLRRCIELRGANAFQATISEIMTRTPRATTADRLALDALRQMEEHPQIKITALPVLESDSLRVVGLLQLHDLLQAGLY